ncbi:MAG: glycosyltransferase family 4 protein [Candidatus Paceibacterota bacterium]|jgi:glycosyltransferase involved in cell wall biosynthesis
MKVAIGVPGKFHLFQLAEQLFKFGYLEQLITSYPKFMVRKYGIPSEKIYSVPLKEVVQRGWLLLPRALKKMYNPQNLIHEIFDWEASLRVRATDFFVGTPATYPKTMQKAKKLGATIIVENGSAHTLYVMKILREEYDRFGIVPGVFQLSHEKLVEKDVLAYRDMDYVSVPSLFVKRTFLEYGIPENKIIHIPYGVDLSEFRQVPKSDNVFRVIYVGGMTLQKGVHYLLKAFSQLNLPNSELVLIGSMSEEMEPFFKRYEGSFTYKGHISQSELYKHYSQGSVFAIASIQDGFGMVLLQAMACGLPVICTTNTGGEDIVRNGLDGFIIPIRSENAIKEKLLYFYENSDKAKEMGKSAKQRVSSGFTWDDYGKRMIAEYKRILTLKK